jgi:hypothetical protein
MTIATNSAEEWFLTPVKVGNNRHKKKQVKNRLFFREERVNGSLYIPETYHRGSGPDKKKSSHRT